MKKYISYKVEANCGSIKEEYTEWRQAWHRYGCIYGDKRISGVTADGSERPITWSGKCR